MWISFLASFTWVKVSTALSKATTTAVQVTGDSKLGSPTVIGGYHLHHAAAGLFLMAVAGWLGIHYAGPRVVRAMAVMYGVGMAFVVDEIGFVVSGVGKSYGYDLEVFTLAVIVAAIMMSSVYFPSFWNTHFPNAYRRMERRALRFWLWLHPPRPPSRAEPSLLRDLEPADAQPTIAAEGAGPPD